MVCWCPAWTVNQTVPGSCHAFSLITCFRASCLSIVNDQVQSPYSDFQISMFTPKQTDSACTWCTHYKQVMRFMTRLLIYFYALLFSFCLTVLPKFVGWIWRRYQATAAVCNHLRLPELWPLPASTFLCFYFLRWLGSTAGKCCTQQQVGVEGRWWVDQLWYEDTACCHNYWQDCHHLYQDAETYTPLSETVLCNLMLINRVLTRYTHMHYATHAEHLGSLIGRNSKAQWRQRRAVFRHSHSQVNKQNKVLRWWRANHLPITVILSSFICLLSS